MDTKNIGLEIVIYEVLWLRIICDDLFIFSLSRFSAKKYQVTENRM